MGRRRCGGPPVHTGMSLTTRRPRHPDGDSSGSCPGHHLRPRGASRPLPGPHLLRPQGLFPSPLQNRLLKRPRLPRQAHQEDRDVLSPSLRPTTILGTRRPRLHPHRPRMHNPPRHGNRHRDRSRQGPALHQQQKKIKKPQDTRNKHDGPHPRQTSRKDPLRKCLIISPNASSRHNSS